MKEIWLTPREIAGTYNFPKTVQGVAHRAKSEMWEKRKVKGQKGGGFEYEVSSIIKGAQEPRAVYNKDLHNNTPAINPNTITLQFDSERYVLVPELNIQVAAGSGVYPLNEDQVGQFVFSKYWLAKKGLSNTKLSISFTFFPIFGFCFISNPLNSIGIP